jgi:dipeptidyl-peptidase 4
VAHADDGATRRLTADGAPVTPPGLQLRSVLGIDGDDVLFTASEEPTETHLWRYRPADGIRRLTAEPGVHSGVRRGGTLVHVAGGAGQPGDTVRVLRESAGSVRADSLDSLSERAELTPRPAMLVLGPRRLLLPGTGHRALGGPATETLLRYQAGFLRRHLHVAEASAAERCSG